MLSVLDRANEFKSSELILVDKDFKRDIEQTYNKFTIKECSEKS
jgi:hypothetical protein